MDVWKHLFNLFRDEDWLKRGKCKDCDQWVYCRGGPMHYRDRYGTMKKCLYEEVSMADRIPMRE
jgi:radical SAM protein with 4Fe4S-binding SPASM domain